MRQRATERESRGLGVAVCGWWLVEGSGGWQLADGSWRMARYLWGYAIVSKLATREEKLPSLRRRGARRFGGRGGSLNEVAAAYDHERNLSLVSSGIVVIKGV